MSLKHKLFKEMFRMSSASSSASQHEGPIVQAQLLDPTQPKPPKTEKISAQPTPTQPDPWVNPTHRQLWALQNCWR